MGHFVEAALQRRGIELACASEDVCAVPNEVARESVVIDFTTPEAFRADETDGDKPETGGTDA